jgi:hypothetical protein
VRAAHSSATCSTEKMTLLPRGVPSQWSWKTVCDRLDVFVAPDIFADGSSLEVLDRFRVSDFEIAAPCRRLYRVMSVNDGVDRLAVESLLMQVAVLLRDRHSTASAAPKGMPRGALTHNQARRVLDYVESNLSRDLTLRELANVKRLRGLT